MNKPLFFQRSTLPHKAVMIHCLDAHGEPIKNAYASGFILKEDDGLYLYTCWHVVTDLDMHALPVRLDKKPKRMALRVLLQKAEEQQTGSKLRAFVLDGLRTLDIDLYDKRDNSYIPKWCQDPVEPSNENFHNIKVHVPEKHDAIKLRLPDGFQTTDLHVLEPDELWKSLVFPGDRVYVVGYPYSYSARGPHQPTPIVLTRYVAGTSIEGRLSEILLDGTGAPGMSGGPVFVEKEDHIYLLGLYAGLIYTADKKNKYKEVGALSTCVDMSLCWTHKIAALRAMRN